MIDNREQSRFELEENGHRTWADYRLRDGRLVIPHVEAEPVLRGTGAANRLMTEVAAHARANRLMIVPLCSYARIWFQRHPEAADLLG